MILDTSLNTVHQAQDTEHGTHLTDLWTVETEQWTLDTGPWSLAGRSRHDTTHRILQRVHRK